MAKKKAIEGISEAEEESDVEKGPKKKAKKEVQKAKKSGRPPSNRRAKYPQIYGRKPIPEQPKEEENKGCFTLASFLSGGVFTIPLATESAYLR